ncbi:MAG: hypothetical protein RhofKO_35930 [Rhodothermales bacterium]
MHVTLLLLFLACPLVLHAQSSTLTPYLGLTVPSDTAGAQHPSLLEWYSQRQQQLSADLRVNGPNAKTNPAAIDPKIWLRPDSTVNAAILWMKPSDRVDAKMRIWGSNPLKNERDDQK